MCAIYNLEQHKRIAFLCGKGCEGHRSGCFHILYVNEKEKSYRRNMMFLFAKLTKEIIFVCTIFLLFTLRITCESP